MERKRSEEEERELDKKIALIREKNQKIEERNKEIEQDKLNSMGAITPKKPCGDSAEKASTSSNNADAMTNGTKKEWNREWDRGKIPAEMWRENVPNMEMNNARLGRDKRQDANQRRKPNAANHQKNGSRPQNGDLLKTVKVGGRLEGRVTLAQNGTKPNHNNNNSQKVNGNSKDSQKGKKPEAQNPSRKNKVVHDGKVESNREEKKKVDKNPTNGQQHRQRKENDIYVVKDILRKLINKTIYLERQEKQNNDNTVENTVLEENGKVGDSECSEKKADANQNLVDEISSLKI